MTSESTASATFDPAGRRIGPVLPRPGRAVGGILLLLVIWLVLLVLLSAFLRLAAIDAGHTTAAAKVDYTLAWFRSPTGMTWHLALRAVVLTPVVWWLATFPSQSAIQTLALRPLARANYRWLGLALGVHWLVMVLLSHAASSSGGSGSSDFMIRLSGNRSLPLAVSLCLVAPWFEEVLFRGYLYQAWRHSWLGPIGTIALTSFVFTAMHAGQYDGVHLVSVLILSLLLGGLREKCGTLVAPLALHVANNLVATGVLMWGTGR